MGLIISKIKKNNKKKYTKTVDVPNTITTTESENIDFYYSTTIDLTHKNILSSTENAELDFSANSSYGKKI